ncbi:DUF1289 domain-containing protein [Abyssibius alkaniclasticus]|uniref:DUF1289 domain-containing protein n=1 Tax=Abyssibius alkaniclasticus TaxID=2881234 RepID=UPI0023641F0D|nr:DUF1289 domain-containing protein [Abyssibius alkaniclasticus]UPH70007.1 DUF1289 domain-containing protein [Abyssibius alkaniclasticus]|tara:strand:+ start:413 stop:643 length:231 start_codon:yes stop_codon:yes gene_type:complete
MSDEIWARDEVESPCVKICVVHPAARICIGCFRTPDEIARWSRLSAEARREIIAALPAREPMLRSERRGRAARLKG